jgi:hypothetical protein
MSEISNEEELFKNVRKNTQLADEWDQGIGN